MARVTIEFDTKTETIATALAALGIAVGGTANAAASPARPAAPQAPGQPVSAYTAPPPGMPAATQTPLPPPAAGAPAGGATVADFCKAVQTFATQHSPKAAKAILAELGIRLASEVTPEQAAQHIGRFQV